MYWRLCKVWEWERIDGLDKKNWIFWELLQDKVTIWRLREFERNDLKVSEGGKSIEVVTATGLNQGGESLKRSAVAILILSQWINSGWFTLHVGPYVLIQIIRNSSGYVKCKLHTQHNLQGTSWILPWQGEVRCPSCAWQPNARDWSGVAEGLSSHAPCCIGGSPGAELLSSVCVRSDWAREFISPSCYNTGGMCSAPQPLGWPKSMWCPSVTGRPDILQIVAWAL